MVRYLRNVHGAKKIAPEGDFCSEPVWSLEKNRFLVQTGAGKTADIPFLSLRELFQSLWDKHCSRSERGLV